MADSDEGTERWLLPNLRKAIAWCRERDSRGVRGVLDAVGQYSYDAPQAARLARVHASAVRAIEREGLRASLSVKLTTLGAAFDRELCRKSLLSICGMGARRRVRIEIDMEGKSLVDFAIHSAIECAGEGYPVTVALQAYLDRTPADLERLIERSVRVRLVKGAYLGDTSDFVETERRLRELVKRMAGAGLPFSLGTHDPEVIEWARAELADKKPLLEFGFLMGLAGATMLSLAGEGWAVAEYIPYTMDGEAYIQRRLGYLRSLEALGRKPAP